MIKIKRRKTDKTIKAIEALKTAKIKNSSYNTPEVNAALREMFYGKCYICENKQTTSFQIEHLMPHHGNVDLKYDWNNLFWSCAHCNNIKNDKYTPILDCTKENIEDFIAFRKKGYFGTEERLIFESLDFRTETENTVKLLQEVYYGSTPQKQIEAKVLRRALRKELSEFKEYVREYQEEEDEQEKGDLRCLLRQELRDSSSFAAFKRWLIRDNKNIFPELYEDITALHKN